jgi:hypothetical protein
VTTTRRHEPEAPEAGRAISEHADDWIRQFIKHLELHFLDASRHLPTGASVSELQAATARAIVATFVDSGMEFQSALELLGQAALQGPSGNLAWNDALNERRFALIDKEIQGTLTAAESTELAGLTRILREAVDSETNLPLKGARALHQKLLRVEAADEAE